MNTKSHESKDESFIWPLLHFLHRYFCICLRLLMIKLYDERGQSMPPIDDRLLLEPATSIAEKIRTKQVTAVQVMNTFIRRIKQINPLLNCVVDERYNDALDEATKVDDLIASNKYTVNELRETKPFLGVPISTKDSIGVKGMIQTCGLWFSRNKRATEDADAIRLMRAAGAIPFVITNVPPLCMWYESANYIYGRTRNPYDTNRMAGGSSGGEGCLLAAAGSPCGIGSDIGGSIRMPAFFNGIFGHKPSPLIVSNNGQYPDVASAIENFSTSIGPLSRYACDLKPMLKIMAGDKAKDLALDEPVNLSSLKCFYQEGDGGGYFVSPVDGDIVAAMRNIMRHFETKLNVKPKHVQFDQLKRSMRIWELNLKADVDFEFADELVSEGEKMNPYTELLKWCLGMSKQTIPALIQAIVARWDRKYGDPEQQIMVDECNDLRREFEQMLGDDGVFIYPTHPTVAPYHNEPIVRWPNFGYTAIFNVLGFPCSAVPMGIGPTERLPVGIQVVANRNQDRLCLAVASELERAFGGWVAPEIIS